MKEGLRQSMAWLHTWVGLLVGWILFFVYLTGTLGYVDTEIDHWMMPEKPFFAETGSTMQQVQLAQTRLENVAPNADSWHIDLIVERDTSTLEVAWQLPSNPDGSPGEALSEVLDPINGQALDYTVRATGGGDLLYHMHYRLHYLPLSWAYWIIGICSMFMFVAIISGIIVHRKIFKDFFTFRLGKGQRSWLDGHNVLSITSLPFHLMITYTGFMFFLGTFLPAPSTLVYGDNNEFGSFYGGMLKDYYTNLEPEISPISTVQLSAPTLPISSFLPEAYALWGDGNITSIDVVHPGKTDAKVVFHPSPSDTVAQTVNPHSLTFDGANGDLLDDTHNNIKHPSMNSWEVLLGLHRGLFASPILRILYVLVGIAGTAMIGTGLLLWSKKRKEKIGGEVNSKHTNYGLAIVDRLNLGTIIGLPIAVAAYFWANHLIPADTLGRQDMEVHAMYLTLLAMFIYPIWRPIEKARIEMLWLAAAVYILLPVLNLFSTNRHLGISMLEGDWIMAGFDITALLCGIVFILFAIKTNKTSPQ